MPKELIQKLRDSGFPGMDGWVEGAEPSLEELIDACGEPFDSSYFSLERHTVEERGNLRRYWSAAKYPHELQGDTPSEAVANLYLAITK